MFNAFIAWPEPTAPVRSTDVPIADNTGIDAVDDRRVAAHHDGELARSSRAARRPRPARRSGARRAHAHVLRQPCVTEGTPELISITMVPGRMPANTLSSPLASTWSTMALVGSMVTTTSDSGGELAQAVRRDAADLLHEVVGDLAPRVVDCTGEAGASPGRPPSASPCCRRRRSRRWVYPPCVLTLSRYRLP